MGWDWECSHHLFYGAQIVRIEGQTLPEAVEYVDDREGWLDYALPSDRSVVRCQQEVLGLPRLAPAPAPASDRPSDRRRRKRMRDRAEAKGCPLVLKKFESGSYDIDRVDGRDNACAYLDAYLVVKSTLVEHSFSKFDSVGTIGWGARAYSFDPAVSADERDALDRVTATLAEEHDLVFGRPGWYDVARETSG